MPESWLARVVWFALPIAAIWALFVFASHYGSCRSSGSAQVWCFILALIFGCLEVLFTLIGPVIRLIVLIMPCPSLSSGRDEQRG